MKILKTASGKNKIKISRNDWVNIGKKAGWSTGGIKGFVEPSSSASFFEPEDNEGPECPKCGGNMEQDGWAGRGYYHWKCLDENCTGYIDNTPNLDPPDDDDYF